MRQTGSDEPKPAHSYIGLIAIAILSSPEKRLVLSDIYQYILDNYTYFHHRGSGWRNSIRHNLSLNDCFMKSGRSANGKGHYWQIHPANLDDFSRGDFRRRRAQRRVRRSLGLTVPEEDDEDDDGEELDDDGDGNYNDNDDDDDNDVDDELSGVVMTPPSSISPSNGLLHVASSSFIPINNANSTNVGLLLNVIQQRADNIGSTIAPIKRPYCYDELIEK